MVDSMAARSAGPAGIKLVKDSGRSGIGEAEDADPAQIIRRHPRRGVVESPI
jgi:hypothetical protein